MLYNTIKEHSKCKSCNSEKIGETEMSNITYPYSDDYMIYNRQNHRYVLTAKCVLDELNVDLASRLNPTGSASAQRNPTSVLNQISRTVYNQIYKRSEFNDVQEYLLAKAKSARDIIKEAMLEQVLYFLFNGDISVYSGVDFKKNTKSESLQDRILAPNTLDVLNRPLRETGTSIMYQGGYFRNKEFSYENDNY